LTFQFCGQRACQVQAAWLCDASANFEPKTYDCCCLLLPACCLLLPTAPRCCLLLVLLLKAAAVVLLQSNSLQSKKQTARHPFRNTSETAKHN